MFTRIDAHTLLEIGDNMICVRKKFASIYWNFYHWPIHRMNGNSMGIFFDAKRKKKTTTNSGKRIAIGSIFILISCRIKFVIIDNCRLETFVVEREKNVCKNDFVCSIGFFE